MVKKWIPAVGYARRSTDMQERSIPDQQAFVNEWAMRHGYRIIRWYIDDAISGTSAKGRNAFEQMIATAEEGGDFETILCYDISRFSRGGTNETGYYLHRLKTAGVDVLFTADGIPAGDDGELIQGVKSWQARQYSLKLARDTIRGQISNIRERKSAPGGVAPYGYDKQHLTVDGIILRTLRWMPDGSKQEFGPNGQLLRVIEPGVNIKKAKSDIIRFVPSTPDRVAVIKRLFDLCIQGYGCHTIAATFNVEGIPSPGGHKWNTSRVAKLLHNPVYRGSIAWNRLTMGSLFGLDGKGVLRPKKNSGWKKNDMEDWIISDGVHEPLVSPEDWEAAQRAVAKRRIDGGKSRPTNRSLLSSLMVCKRCGHGFTICRDRRWPGPEGEGYRTYRCTGYHRYGKCVCGLVNVPAPALETFVLQAIKRVFLGNHETVAKAIDAFVKTVLAPQTKEKCSPGDDRELELLNRKIKATVAMLTDPSFEGLDELRTTLADLKAKRDALESRRKRNAPRATPAFTEAQLRAWANDQFATLDQMAPRANVGLKDRQLVEAFVERIEIDPDTKTGVVVIAADLETAMQAGFTREPIGDYMGAHEWCQPPETIVRTPAGDVRICDLRTGDVVVSYDVAGDRIVGECDGQTIAITCRRYEGDMLRVEAGGKTTWCTPEHLWSVRGADSASEASVVLASRLRATVDRIPVVTERQEAVWMPIDSVTPEPYSGLVYSMAVDEYQHYIADGIVTHNCFYGWREGAAHVYLGPNNATDLWQVKKVNPQNMVHLTEKPVELATRAMQYSSRPGENVLDLFGGSGSTLMGAEQTGRHAFLMELDPLYCDVIVQRWEKFTGRKAERVAAETLPAA